MRTCVKFTFANKIEAIHERSLVSVKAEPRSTEQPLFAPFINIDHAVNDLMDTEGVHLILGTQAGAFKRWEAFKT